VTGVPRCGSGGTGKRGSPRPSTRTSRAPVIRPPTIHRQEECTADAGTTRGRSGAGRPPHHGVGCDHRAAPGPGRRRLRGGGGRRLPRQGAGPTRGAWLRRRPDGPERRRRAVSGRALCLARPSAGVYRRAQSRSARGTPRRSTTITGRTVALPSWRNPVRGKRSSLWWLCASPCRAAVFWLPPLPDLSRPAIRPRPPSRRSLS